jgi:hypothetical protein
VRHVRTNKQVAIVAIVAIGAESALEKYTQEFKVETCYALLKVLYAPTIGKRITDSLTPMAHGRL